MFGRHEDGKTPWDRQPGESDAWYHRFHTHFLLMGAERTLEGAFRPFVAGAQSGHNSGALPPPRRMPGSWRDAARKWRWDERARAYDDDERSRIRKVHFEAVKRANERHQIILRSAFGKALQQSQALDWTTIKSPAVFVPLLGQLIRLEREVLGAPLNIEVTHRNGTTGDATDYERATQEASEEADKRFAATPEMFAAVLQVLEAHEVKPEAGPDAGSATDLGNTKV